MFYISKKANNKNQFLIIHILNAFFMNFTHFFAEKDKIIFVINPILNE